MVQHNGSWPFRGIAYGGLGAIAAFNVSSLVHFNFGDGEVVMALWLVTGLVFAVRRIAFEAQDAEQTKQASMPPSLDSSNRNRLQEPELASESSVRAARAKPS